MFQLIKAIRLPISQCQIKTLLKDNTRKISHTACLNGGFTRSEHFSRMVMKRRQRQLDLEKVQGSIKPARRSTFTDWNLDAELTAFCKRLSEEVDDDLLETTLRDASYVADEMKKMESAGLENIQNIESNVELAAAGQSLIRDFCSKYFRWSYPLLPEDGIQAIVSHLLSDEVLGQAGSCMGFRELLLSREYPPETATYATALKALTSAINSTSGLDRCQKFILDFIVTQTTGKDIWDMWQLTDPFSVLETILASSQMGPPEPRIIDSLGATTIESCFYVGIFSNQKIIGSSYGETLEAAKETASLESLNVLFNTPLSRNVLQYGNISPEVAECNEPHSSIGTWKIPQNHPIQQRLRM